MPYTRCDVNCIVKNPQPGHYDVGQEESCLVYENYNLDYERTDVDCKTTTQPDIREGWNGDFIRVKTDGLKVTGVSKKMVKQTIYKPTDVDCQPISFVCFNEPPAIGIVLDTNSGDVVFITPDTYDEEIFFSTEQYADYFLELEGNRGSIEPELLTLINPNDLVSN